MTGSRSRRSSDADGDPEFRGGEPPRPGEISSEPSAEALRWIAGHCRFVTTSLPRGELGVQFAAELLAAIPDACRRRVPDLTGTAPELLARCIDFGLLAEMPSARVVRAVPRLIAAHSPVLELRGKRCWTLWLVHLLDAGMLAKIQRRTPASQIEVCPPSPSPSTRSRSRSRGELSAEVQALTAELAAERSACTEFRGQCEGLVRERDAKGAALDRVLLEAAGLVEVNTAMAAELAQARGRVAAFEVLQVRFAEVSAELAQVRNQVGPLREENARKQAENEEATELIRRLSERLAGYEQVGELGVAAVKLVKSMLGRKKGNEGEPGR